MFNNGQSAEIPYYSYQVYYLVHIIIILFISGLLSSSTRISPAIGKEQLWVQNCTGRHPAALGQRTRGFRGTSIWTWTAMCPCRKTGQCYPWVHEMEQCQQWRWCHTWGSVQLCLPQVKRDKDTLEQPLNWGDWSTSSCKERQRELRLSSQKKSARGIPLMYINTWREGVKKMEPGIFQWCLGTWKETEKLLSECQEAPLSTSFLCPVLLRSRLPLWDKCLGKHSSCHSD